MISLPCALLASLGLCLLLTPLMARWALVWNLVDRPDGRRKMHHRVTPVSGGLAVLLSSTGAIVTSLLIPGVVRESLLQQRIPLLGLFLGVSVIAAVGVVDDFGLLRGRHKLFGQIISALVVLAFGGVVQRVQIFGFDYDLGVLALPLSLLWLLGAVNSLNLLDGMDGLLGSVGVIVCLTLAALSCFTGAWTATVVALALAGALLGFLRYNLPPASIFLGDCGSMIIGLVVGTLAMQSCLKAPTTIVLSTPVILLTLPLFDTLAAIVRRKLTGRSIYTTDRGHLHHCLLRSGLSRPGVLLLTSFFCLLTGVGVLASRTFDNELFALLTGVSVVGILVVTKLFGHAEALLIKQRLLALSSSLMQKRHDLAPRQLEVRLQGSVNWTRLWDQLTEQAGRLNLCQLRLDVNAPSLHEGYHARWDVNNQEGEFVNLWKAQIPLTAHGLDVGRLEIAGPRDAEPVWRKIATFSAVMEAFSMELSAETHAAATRSEALTVSESAGTLVSAPL